MNKVNSFYANGWLPAGLVLNTAIVPKSQSSDGASVSFLPAMPLSDFGDGAIGIQQASRSSMVVLKGKLLSTVLLADISVPPTVDVSSDLGADPTQACLYTMVNPYSDPCMLMHPARFEGTIEVWSGSDVPKHTLFADVPRRASGVTAVKVDVYKPVATDVEGVQYSALLVGLPCAWFVPETAATQHVCVADKADLGPNSCVRGLVFTYAPQEQLDLLTLHAGDVSADNGAFVSLLDFVRVPDYAWKHTRMWHGTVSTTEISAYSPTARIASMDGSVLAQQPGLEGVTHVVFFPLKVSSQLAVAVENLQMSSPLLAQWIVKTGQYQTKRFAVPDNCVFKSDQTLSMG